jgi:hypothetical protein
MDLRQYTTWCQLHTIGLFQARRADIECFARDPGRQGPRLGDRDAPAVHDRRVLPICG